MSDRDGVQDADYDGLRKSGLSREQCWAVLDCTRNPKEVPKPNAAKTAQNKAQSGVRVPGPPVSDDPGPPVSDDPGV